MEDPLRGLSDAEFQPGRVKEESTRTFLWLLADPSAAGVGLPGDAAGIRGSLVLLASVDESGQVGGVSLEESSGHPALDGLALELSRKIRFNPVRFEGNAVPVSVRLPMTLVPPPPGRVTRRAIGGEG